ncbi:putative sporulation protein YtxC [Ferdinandcohnia quinoae]|uniref:Sporulation protein YtxC n=1 Tax=Fredinandcohnia quinoae TaxID=2918902 RepID=A0AAW5EDS1_9BACI|nr:putative sporulation protein YtxC [Fredinandcohnia sp. SECRCQ15]MCH1627303.1 putative sporulation protein YtxC [Fredinandcohnia sp. SECRCQ15]
MIEIYFQETLDANKIYMSICARAQAFSINYIRVSYDRANVVSIFIAKKNQYVLRSVIIPALTEYIIQNKEDEWILSMIETIFYFTDYDEKKQILEIAKSLLDGNSPDIPIVPDSIPREQVIAEILSGFLKEPISFSFESFLKFRLRSYTENLLHIVELAIDEYKLEQEYQAFVQGLRDFTVDRESKLEQIHILHDGHFTFYNNQFLEIAREELIKLIDRKLILRQPMYIDSTVLAPLVSIAPKSIFIYTNDVDNGMVQTIVNVFLEKVNIYSMNYFEQLKLKKLSK